MIFNLLLQRSWLDYTHLYVFGKSLHQQEYKVLRKGLEAGLSKQQVSNLFNSLEALGNISPHCHRKFSSARNGKVQADFSMLVKISISIGPYAKEFVVLGKQNKVYYTRARQLSYDIQCSKLFLITSTYNSRKFKLYYPVPTRREESQTHPR